MAGYNQKGALNNNYGHGLSRHPLYDHWRQMLQRCENESHVGYPNYGGRGILVCEDWHDITTYVKYVEEELGSCPGKDYSIDRIDNDKNYEPGNIRWASRSEQNGNQRLRRHVVPVGPSGYRGVRLHKKTGRYQARGHIRGKEVSLKYWDTPEEAARAYDLFVLEHLGDRAVTNFPRSDYDY